MPLFESLAIKLLINTLIMSSRVSRPKLSALIIDDEIDICYLLGNILKQRNIQTVFVGSIAEADKILQFHPDFFFIFLDNHLPDGQGVDYISSLKKKSPYSHLIMITAYDTSADRQQVKMAGIDSFIGKPFSKEIIFKTIEHFGA